MKNKLLALLLALVVVFSLASCSDVPSDDDKSGDVDFNKPVEGPKVDWEFK